MNITKMKQFEEEKNMLFVEAYDLLDEHSLDVPIEEVTLSDITFHILSALRREL